jgi:hypothetical protein
MRFVAALLATILVGGTALLAPRPVYASAEGEIDIAPGFIASSQTMC